MLSIQSRVPRSPLLLRIRSWWTAGGTGGSSFVEERDPVDVTHEGERAAAEIR